MSTDGRIGLGHQDSIDRLGDLAIRAFDTPGNHTSNSSAVKARSRQISGSFIWIIQIQHHVAPLTTRFATDDAHRSDYAGGVREMVSLAYKITRPPGSAAVGYLVF